jgi:hypothetical protein
MVKGAPTFWQNLKRENIVFILMMSMASLLCLQRPSLMQVFFFLRNSTTHHALCTSFYSKALYGPLYSDMNFMRSFVVRFKVRKVWSS